MTDLTSRPNELRRRFFGSYKAEWLRELMFDLFTEPSYFPELSESSPCVLLGGRGTGKTTVLRCMSYEGRFAISGKNPKAIVDWPYYGLYYRVNTNRVTAFAGPELTEERWIKTFGHYLNLVLCDLTIGFLKWYTNHCSTPLGIASELFANVATSLAVEPADSLPELAHSIAAAKRQFEVYINNVAEDPPLRLSMQGAPLDELLAGLHQSDLFRGKIFFFLLDEYENFTDNQQRIVNTLIKHSGELYSFKIGVRELGWRVRTTLNENEQLVSPADYNRINIFERFDPATFETFAVNVSNERIGRIETGAEEVSDLYQLLPSLTEDNEATLLDRNDGTITEADRKLRAIIPGSQSQLYASLTQLQRYCIVSWAGSRSERLEDTWRSYVDNRRQWTNRFNNYNHSLLYSIRSGKRGIRKYYCGVRTFTQMAASNIRYFLELLDQSLSAHVDIGKTLSEPIDFETQTNATQRVGRKNLAELEGLSVHGGKLTKLVLGLGRIFQVMAADPFGHTPEVNQFYLSQETAFDWPPDSDRKVSDLLGTGVMHLALSRSPGNKLLDETDIREYDYMLHPIFSSFFVFSWRRKRKFVISPRSFLGLVNDHKRAIKTILEQQNRKDSAPLPDQMNLFGPYYDVVER